MDGEYCDVKRMNPGLMDRQCIRPSGVLNRLPAFAQVPKKIGCRFTGILKASKALDRRAYSTRKIRPRPHSIAASKVITKRGILTPFMTNLHDIKMFRLIAAPPKPFLPKHAAGNKPSCPGLRK